MRILVPRLARLEATLQCESSELNEAIAFGAAVGEGGDNRALGGCRLTVAGRDGFACASRRRPIHDDALIDALAEAMLDVWERLGLQVRCRALAAE
jgi:hypothetical protein